MKGAIGKGWWMAVVLLVACSVAEAQSRALVGLKFDGPGSEAIDQAMFQVAYREATKDLVPQKVPTLLTVHCGWPNLSDNGTFIKIGSLHSPEVGLAQCRLRAFSCAVAQVVMYIEQQDKLNRRMVKAEQAGLKFRARQKLSQDKPSESH